MTQATKISRHKVRYPNLFLAGAPKCGTTSLAAWLGQHPEIFAPTVKEPILFATDLTQRDRPLPEELAQRHFTRWSNEKYALDGSTHYFYSRSAASEILTARPDARVYVLLRNPADAVHSMFHQLKFNGAETLDTLEQSLDMEEARSATLAPMRFGFPENLLYRRVFGYRENIGNMLRTIGRERLEVLLLDDLIDNPQAVVSSIFEKLALDPSIASQIDYAPQNSAKRARLRLIHEIASYPPPWIGHFSRRLLPSETRSRFREWLKKMNMTKTQNPKLDDATRSRLNTMFEDDIAFVERFLERDLTHWRKGSRT